MPDDGGTHLVILVHGINTRALWMDEIKPALEDAGFSAAATSFGEYSVARFLMPGEFLRRKAIERVVVDINTALRLHRPERLSVISHSFGTYIVSRIIADHPEFRWFRVIFCGSVVREDFPLFQYIERFEPPLINEIGTRDFWPALAECAGWGYGSVGSTGFNRPPVESRWHTGFRHSDFLTRNFAETFWVPFLKGEKPRRGDPPTALPLLMRVITRLPLKLVPPALLIGLAVIFGLQQFHNRLPFVNWDQPPPVEHYPAHRDPIPKATTEPEPARRAFAFPNGDGGHQTSWEKRSSNGIAYWAESYRDGREPTRFVIDHRTAWDDDCDGTVVTKDIDPRFQIFIPDSSAGCSRHQLALRDGGYGNWSLIGPIAEQAR